MARYRYPTVGVDVNKLGTPRDSETGEPTVRQSNESHGTRPAGMSVYSWTMATKGILERIEYSDACENGVSESDAAIQHRMNERLERLYEKQRAVRAARSRGA